MLFKRLLLHFSAILILLAPIWPNSVSLAQSYPTSPPITSSIQFISVSNTPDYYSCGNEIVPVFNQEYEQEVVVLVNQERAERGLPPLKRVEALDQAARYHSADLGQDNYFDHDSYDRIGDNLSFVCLWWARIQTYYTNVRAENIAAGYQTPEDVVQAWMGSLGHRQNILSTYNDEIGVGYFEGEGSYNRYWTQDFGDRSGVYPVVINGEATETQDRIVSLYVYGNWSEMRLRNNDESWTPWQTFQNTLDWELPPYDGEHTVSVEMKDLDNSTTSSDTIRLIAQPSNPLLGNLPEIITFTYSLPQSQYLPGFAKQFPLNVGNPETLEWEIITQDSWFTVTPTVGTTPGEFMIIPNALITPTRITSTSVITVSARTTSGMTCTPHELNVSLKYIEDTFQQVYIPILMNKLP